QRQAQNGFKTAGLARHALVEQGMDDEIELTLPAQGGGDQPVGQSAVAPVRQFGGGEGREIIARQNGFQPLCSDKAELEPRRFGLCFHASSYPQGPRCPPSSSVRPTVGTRQPPPVSRPVVTGAGRG